MLLILLLLLLLTAFELAAVDGVVVDVEAETVDTPTRTRAAICCDAPKHIPSTTKSNIETAAVVVVVVTAAVAVTGTEALLSLLSEWSKGEDKELGEEEEGRAAVDMTVRGMLFS